MKKLPSNWDGPFKAQGTPSGQHKIMNSRGEKIMSNLRQYDAMFLVDVLNFHVSNYGELLEFAKDVRDNYDCDNDAHKYGTHCRACRARKVLEKCV